MNPPENDDAPAAFPHRIKRLEQDTRRMDEELDRKVDKADAVKRDERVERLERELDEKAKTADVLKLERELDERVARLDRKMDWVIASLWALTLVIASATITFAITIAGGT